MNTTSDNKELVLSDKPFAGDTEFSDTVSVLKEARDFLRQTVAGVALARRAGALCADEAELAHVRLSTLEAERPSRTCALVLGEFKAGKSTLINALVGKEVAASDVFELTQVVCRIVPTPNTTSEYVELFWREPNKPPVRLGLATFLARANARELGDFSQASVYVDSPLDMVLVDTPGLGATESHELDALKALGTADVALCVIDCESLGGGRDAATIARMQEIDLPFICVLTKADILAPGETDLVCDYITDSLGVPQNRIFPVSAQQKTKTGHEPGMEKLQGFLRREIGPNAADLRARALLAQSRDVAAAYVLCLHEAQSAMHPVLREAQEYAETLDEQAEAVTNDLCSSLSSMLHARLRLQIEQTQAGKAELTEADFLRAVEECFAEDQQKGFVEYLKAQLDARFQDEWVSGFKQNLQMLYENLKAVQDEGNKAAAQDAQHLINNEERKKEAINEATGSAISGAAVAAGVLALGHIFLPGVLFAAPFLVKAWQKYTAAQKMGEAGEDSRTLQSRIDAWREAVIKDHLNDLRPKLLQMNQTVAQQAANNFAQKHPEWPLPVREFSRVYTEAQHLEAALDAHRAGS